jgi:hypothetical protein
MSHPDRYHAQEAIDRLPPVALSAHAGDVRSAVDASWTPERPREQVHETDEPRDGTRRLRIFLRGRYVTRAHQLRRPEFQAAEWMIRWSARTATGQLAEDGLVRPGRIDVEWPSCRWATGYELQADTTNPRCVSTSSTVIPGEVEDNPFRDPTPASLVGLSHAARGRTVLEQRRTTKGTRTSLRSEPRSRHRSDHDGAERVITMGEMRVHHEWNFVPRIRGIT